jgi:hypothetical protein
MPWSDNIKSKLYDITKGTNINYNGATVQELFANNADFDTTIACDVFKDVEIGRKVFNSTDDTRYYRFPTDDDNYYSNGNLYVCTGVLNNNERNSKTMYQWGYGELADISDASSSSYRLRIGNIKTNDFCTRCVVSKVNAETGSTTYVTLDDLLNPSDNYYIKLSPNNSITSYVNDNGTLNSNALSIQPFLVFDNYNSMLSAFSLTSAWTWGENIYKNGASYASTNASTIAYTNKSTNDGFEYIFTNVKADSVDTENVTVWKNDYVILTSTITKTASTTTQTITGGISLKFFVKLLQSMGCYICVDSLTGTWTADYFKTNENVLIGELDKDGKPTYNWLTAEQRLTSKSPNLDSEWSNENNPYDPNPKDHDKNHFDNIGLNGNYGTSKFVTWYSLTGEQLNGLKDFINDEERPIGFDSMKNIISVSEFPFDVDTICSTAGTSMIRIGKETYGSFGGDTIAKIILTQERIIDLGAYTFNRSYNNFLDYAPYTDIKLYLPYCNDLITLNPDIVMGETINCYLIADIITGSVRGVVTCNTCTIAENSGTFGNTVPLTAENVGAYKSAMLNSIGGVASGVLSTAVGGATGNPIAIASGAMSVIGSITQLSAVDNTSYVDVKGSSSPCTMYNRSATPYVIITQARPKRPDNYAHTIGYPCYKTLTINDLSGYFVCENTDIKINATETEKSMIKNILEAGCYK